MNFRRNICGAIVVFWVISAQADNIAVFGGQVQEMVITSYGALVTSSEMLDPLTFSGSITPVNITSVSMNSSEYCLIGGLGQIGTVYPPYAAIVDPSGSVTSLTFTGSISTGGNIQSVAINNSGNGIIGGWVGFGPIYAAFVPPSGDPLQVIEFPSPINAGGSVTSVAINNSGIGLIGAHSNTNFAFAAYVFPTTGTATAIPLTLTGGLPVSGNISSVSINSSGNGIIGGRDLTGGTLSSPAYAALVYPSSSTVTRLSLGFDMDTSGNITSVAINNSGNWMIGGQDLSSTVSQPAYASLFSSGTVHQLALGTMSGIVNSVAINNSGNGIIGGQYNTMSSSPAFAFLVDSSGDLTPISLGSLMDPNGTVSTVAINDAGSGMIGGQDGNGNAYAALFIPSTGTVTVIPFLSGSVSFSGEIFSVAVPRSVDSIPTGSLSGNNLIFANYINEFAPEDAIYFIPSEFDGTLNDAVQSAAPTRNGVSIYTASNNLFNLTTSFANHIRMEQTEPVAQPNTIAMNELLASRTIQKKESKKNSIWFDAIGALAYQKSQHQTVGFNPTTGGAILAYDRLVNPKWRVGGGLSYLFTHIHEKEGQGWSNINQEDAFLYSSWDNQRFYLDFLVMGGLLQINQVRNITMTGFTFRSSSKPHGWQLVPHLEVGFKKAFFNPFVMLDWANAWQGSYKEKGDGPFNAAQKSYYGSLLRTEAGVRFYETFFFTSWNLSFQEKVSYVNTQSFNGGKVNAFLVGSPGSFTVETLSSAQNLGVAQVAMTIDPLKVRYPTTTLFYQGEFGTQYQSHQINLELAWLF